MKLIEFIKIQKTTGPFPESKEVVVRKAWADILNVYGQERNTIDLPLNVEVIKLKFPYSAIHKVNPNDLKFKIDGNIYEAVGTFENVNFQNETAYIKAKRVM